MKCFSATQLIIYVTSINAQRACNLCRREWSIRICVLQCTDNSQRFNLTCTILFHFQVKSKSYSKQLCKTQGQVANVWTKFWFWTK